MPSLEEVEAHPPAGGPFLLRGALATAKPHSQPKRSERGGDATSLPTLMQMWEPTKHIWPGP